VQPCTMSFCRCAWALPIGANPESGGALRGWIAHRSLRERRTTAFWRRDGKSPPHRHEEQGFSAKRNDRTINTPVGGLSACDRDRKGPHSARCRSAREHSLSRHYNLRQWKACIAEVGARAKLTIGQNGLAL
jgi:hypothetical protein